MSSLTFLIIFSLILTINGIQITLSTGKIEGKILTTQSNNTGYVFLGVPYSQPPVGDLRFKNARPNKPWSGVISCREFGNGCLLNTTSRAPTIKMSEDCLLANVFVGLECKESSPCPVIFYIGGGGFNFGTPSTTYPPEFLIDYYATRNVIFVTLGFRLGALAFWQTGTEDAPGDYGFFDIIQALRWVHEEISNFGGDPTRINLMGYSSGGTTVTLLTLTPETKGLFSRAIVMSGAPGKTLIESSILPSKILAINAGCATEEDWNNGTEFEKIVTCMRKLDAQEIVGWQREIEILTPIFAGPINDKRLWPESLDKMRDMRLPYSYFIGSTLNEYADSKDKVPQNANRTYLVEACKTAALQARFIKNTGLISEACTDEYTKQYGKDYRNAQGNLTSDVKIFVDVWNDAISMREKVPGNVFLYSFDYLKEGVEGFPLHSQDMAYFIGTHVIHPFTSQDDEITEKFTGLISEFAKTGRPNSHWRPLAAPTGFNYYSINIKNINKDFYHYDSIKFWTKIAPNLEKGAEFRTKNAEFEENRKEPNWNIGFWVVFGILVVALLLIVLYLVVFRCKKE